MSYGHQDTDTPPRPLLRRYANLPMTSDRANDVLIAFWEATPYKPRLERHGDGFNIVVPAEYIESIMCDAGFLDERESE